MAALPKTDVVIIGLGAAGGIAAYVLTKAGLDVVGLEAGPRLSNDDFLAQYDELDGGGMRNRLGAPKWNKEVPTWRLDDASPTTQNYGASGMVNAVGGTSIHYATQSWRYRVDDLAIRSSTIDRYGEAAIPEGSSLIDWPVTYDDLEPYYENVEYLIGVSGQGGANVFESPRAKDYPMPPLRSEGYSELARDAMDALGYHPFPKPTAIASEEYNGRPACTYCGFCSGFGCWNDSKSSTLVTAIADAEKTGKFDVRAGARVTKILTDSSAKATGVEYTDDQGETQQQPAGVVVLSSYVFENNRLLFLSGSDKFPDGLGNTHGQLGKHFMAHLYIISNGYFPGTRFNTYGGALVQGVAMDDFNGDNFDHTGLDFIRGSLIFPLNNAERLPIGVSRGVPPGLPQWGSAYKQWLNERALSVSGMMGQGEFLPYQANYLDLDPKVTDDTGMPVVRITFNAYENELKQGAYITTKLEAMLKKMGAEQTWSYPVGPTPVNTHAYGGTRMGKDPAESFVDEMGMAHAVPNLAVMGGSIFCSSAGYNPTLTIQALAWRTAEHIAKEFSALAN
jgi:gluconate 2-dehydrogenase alpha chain